MGPKLWCHVATPDMCTCEISGSNAWWDDSCETGKGKLLLISSICDIFHICLAKIFLENVLRCAVFLLCSTRIPSFYFSYFQPYLNQGGGKWLYWPYFCILNIKKSYQRTLWTQELPPTGSMTSHGLSLGPTGSFKRTLGFSRFCKAVLTFTKKYIL